MIDKPSILARTHYGTRIYSQPVHERWPGETAMTITGDDCGCIRNPLSADGAKTLHVWIEKLPSEQRLHDRIARHHDESGIIPDGDCFDFAEQLYGLSGQELLDHLNSELHLHLEPEWNPYGAPARKEAQESAEHQPHMSFFRAPISNVTPEKEVTLEEVYEYIVGNQARERTARLRAFTDQKKARQFKSVNFDYITAAGVFSVRKDSALVRHSGLMTVDFDHVPDVEALFARLLADDYFDTALAFRSPSGDGIKWIVPVDLNGFTHAKFFEGISGYIHKTYGILIDQSGRDVSRACFLPYDPQAYLNPKYQSSPKEEQK